MSDLNGLDDRRVRRSRTAIRDAFVKLVLEKEFASITVNEIIDLADVARSTFYEHFTSKDDVLCAVMEPLLVPVAECICAPEEPAHLKTVLEHFMSNRRLAAAVLSGSPRNALSRALEKLLEARLPADGGAPRGLVSAALARWQLGLVAEWLAGRHHCRAEAVSALIYRGTLAFVSPGLPAEDVLPVGKSCA